MLHSILYAQVTSFGCSLSYQTFGNFFFRQQDHSLSSTRQKMAQQIERNQEATIYIGNLDERCTESLVWELMLQAGPVGKSHPPLSFESSSLMFSSSQCTLTKGQSDTDTSKLWFRRVSDGRRR